MFAQKKVTLPPGKHKIIILDEVFDFNSVSKHSYRCITTFDLARSASDDPLAHQINVNHCDYYSLSRRIQ